MPKYVPIRKVIEFIKKSADELWANSAKDFMDSCYGEIISRDIKRQLDYFTSVYTAAAAYFAGEAVYVKNYLLSFEYDADFIKRFRCALDGCVYSDIRMLLNSYDRAETWQRRQSAPCRTEDTEFFKKAREKFNKRCKLITENFFSSDEKGISENSVKTAQLCFDTYTLLRLF